MEFKFKPKKIIRKTSYEITKFLGLMPRLMLHEKREAENPFTKFKGKGINPNFGRLLPSSAGDNSTFTYPIALMPGCRWRQQYLLSYSR